MGTITDKKVKAFRNENFHVEKFDCPADVIKDSENRSITNGAFKDMRRITYRQSFEGVESWDKTVDYMVHGYQPIVDKLQNTITVQGDGHRVRFSSGVEGFAPIVPLAIMGVPNSMVCSRMKPIKSKVVNVYYIMTCPSLVGSSDIMDAGKLLLSALLELEMQGYKFNLYCTQTYWEQGSGCDMLCVKVKGSNTPLDLKRMSFALAHVAFFRVVGFDWYSRVPGGKYRCSYGSHLGASFNGEQIQKGFEELFNEKCVVFELNRLLHETKDHVKDVLVGKTQKDIKAKWDK